MALVFSPSPQQERAPHREADTGRARSPSYGRHLEEFTPGTVFVHPRGFTIDRGVARSFAAAFLNANPLYLNDEYARAHGFPASPVCPQLVFNLVLSLGVQNDSEKAAANLGYYNARFLRPVYPGDTLRSLTRVHDSRVREEGQPGIVHIQTLGLNQRDQTVLQYERKVMVPPSGKGLRTDPGRQPEPEPAAFPWEENARVELPSACGPYPAGLTGRGSYLEDFSPGDIVVHEHGRTITDEHMYWTCVVGNTHPLHTDRVYSAGLSGPMSGEPIVYGGLVFAWLEGLASRDISENALWQLGFTEGYHTQPAHSGDTVAALSRILAIEPGPPGLEAGILTVQLVGVKNVSGRRALEMHGADLFVKENDKKKIGKEKIASKIFEIEQQFLVKRKGSF
jgi:2-methylfumaryl-CoA hydratase